MELGMGTDKDANDDEWNFSSAIEPVLNRQHGGCGGLGFEDKSRNLEW